jgi:hypothetical protein
MISRMKTLLCLTTFALPCVAQEAAPAQINPETACAIAVVQNLRTKESLAATAKVIDGLVDEIIKIVTITIKATDMTRKQAEMLKELVARAREEIVMVCNGSKEGGYRPLTPQESERSMRNNERCRELVIELSKMTKLHAELMRAFVRVMAKPGVIEGLLARIKELSNVLLKGCDAIDQFPAVGVTAAQVKDWYSTKIARLVATIYPKDLQALFTELAADMKVNRKNVKGEKDLVKLVSPEMSNKVLTKMMLIGHLGFLRALELDPTVEGNPLKNVFSKIDLAAVSKSQLPGDELTPEVKDLILDLPEKPLRAFEDALAERLAKAK